jgi:hypothetical protein
MSRLLGFFALVALMLLSMGCESGLPKAEMVEVKGTVTLDGNPLKEGQIAFITPGFPSDMLPVTNGAFSGKAAVGENRRVEVYADKEGPMEKDPMSGEAMKTRISIVASAFNTESTLTATVVKGGENNFKFDVKGPPP